LVKLEEINEEEAGRGKKGEDAREWASDAILGQEKRERSTTRGT
jgi:hypothetical protein